MRAVNLLPADARVSKGGFASVGSNVPIRRTLQLGGGVALLLTIMMVGLFMHERSVVHSAQSTLANDQARLAAMQAEVDAVRSDQQEASARMNAVTAVADSRMNWDRTMGELARVLPADTVLSTLQATAPVTAASVSAVTATATGDTPVSAPTGTSTLTVSGSAPSYVRVANVLDRLSLLPWLTDVTLGSTSKQSGGTATFSINATVSEVH